MRFASHQIREKMAKRGNTSLSDVKSNTKRRFQQVLSFMKEWSQDLMERENELHQQRELYSTSALHEYNPNIAASSLNIQQLIKQQFYKKVESLYMKQLGIADLSQSQRNQPISEEDSLNQSRQSSNTFGDDEFKTSGQQHALQSHKIRICDI